MSSIKANTEKPVLLVALGGNALIRNGGTGSIEEQFRNLAVPLSQVARLSKKYQVILTHGNGPQVGSLLLQQECCAAVPRLPLEILVAQTQGQIGYMIESTLDNELMELNREHEQLIITVLTYVLVDKDDPAFANPTKPIGPVFTEEAALKLPYRTSRTQRGFQRVVASPRPITIIEKREIRHLLKMGFIVISCGGGGIPVVREGRAYQGIDAVIDKDLASAKLAEEVGVDTLVIATDVQGVAVGYGTEHERFLKNLSTAEGDKLRLSGEFPPGSMGPKVEAAMTFLKMGGKRAVICSIDSIEEAVAGRAGTEMVV